MEALISVVVPVYKTEKYLSCCIDSLLKQKYKNVEIILVDDGSPDRCGEICDQYAKDNINIKVIHQMNKGVSAARNAGIAVALGEYIAFVDSDDYVVDDMYENMYLLAQKYKADIVQCGRINSSCIVNQQNDTCRVEKIDTEQALIELMCSRKIRSSTCDKLYRRELFEDIKYNVKISTGEDFVLNYLLIKKSNVIIITDKIGYIYYERNDSCSKGRIKKKHFDIFEIMSEMAENEKNEELYRYWTLRKAMFAMNFLRRMIPENDFSKFDEFRKYMIDARFIICNPNKYKISNDKHFHFHVLIIWFFPKIYKWLIKKGSVQK